MPKEDLIPFIQKKSQKCLLHVEEPDKREHYFFLNMMELFCEQHGKVMMSELATFLFKAYTCLRKKASNLRDVQKQQDWCLLLASLVRSALQKDEHIKAAIDLEDSFAIEVLIYAAHFYYMVVYKDSRFDLIGCKSLPVGISAIQKAIGRTDVYEYMLDLTAGITLPNFQELKFLYASKPFKSGFTAQAPDYRATITGAVISFSDRLRNTFLYKHQLRGLSEKLHERKIEEPGYWRNRCLLRDDGEAALSNSSTEQKQDSETTSSPEVPSTLESYRSRAQEHMAFLFLTEEFTSKYTIGDLLGHGGGGAVYEGVRKADDTEVAIKFVTNDDDYGMMTIPGQTRVVPVEVGLMEMVNKPSCSPYVLELLEWFKIPSYDILILERPRPCMSLRDFCWHHGGKLPEALARKIMLQVVQAASWCCDCGVFHNDIKPENFLINTETLQVKLIDFGCGDLLKDSPYTYCPGTDAYIPPEWYRYRQYMGRPATVWSLGIVLFQLVHGDIPFQTCEEVTNGCLHFAPGLSKDCCKLISSCLNQDPKSRPTFEKILKHKWFMEGKRSIKHFPVRHLAKLFQGRLHKRKDTETELFFLMWKRNFSTPLSPPGNGKWI